MWQDNDAETHCRVAESWRRNDRDRRASGEWHTGGEAARRNGVPEAAAVSLSVGRGECRVQSEDAQRAAGGDCGPRAGGAGDGAPRRLRIAAAEPVVRRTGTARGL